MFVDIGGSCVLEAMKMLSSFCSRCKEFTFVWNIYFNIFKSCSFISKELCEHSPQWGDVHSGCILEKNPES